MDEINTLVQERLKKLSALQAEAPSGKAVEPYGRRFDVTHSSQKILEGFEEGTRVKVAGRLRAIRAHGKTVFADLHDEKGKIQLYLKEEVIGEEAFTFFSTKIDIGDILGAEGTLFKTKTGEASIRAETFQLLAKSLRPLPEKWHGLKDVETRYRQRYVDLLMNQEVRGLFVLRSRLLQELRGYLDGAGFLEVETPMMHPVAGGAAGEPFRTYHKALDIDLYMRLAPELYLKKLLVGGFDRVYEIAKSFRNEGISTQHNPEFTMLEAYAAYWNYEDMMTFVEKMLSTLVEELVGSTKVTYATPKGDLEIDFAPPWERFSFSKWMEEKFKIRPNDPREEMIRKLREEGRKQNLGITVEGNFTRSHIVNLVADLVTPQTKGRPVFMTDYYTVISPLAKSRVDNPEIAERFELFVAGMEIANGYSELNDPIEQRRRFEEQVKEKGEESQIDEDFLRALEYGMPPAAGLGIGIDRFLMLLANKSSIREVILFPQLKPEK